MWSDLDIRDQLERVRKTECHLGDIKTGCGQAVSMVILKAPMAHQAMMLQAGPECKETWHGRVGGITGV